MEEHKINKYHIAIASLILIIIGVIAWVIISIINENDKSKAVNIVQSDNIEITQVTSESIIDEYENMEPCMTNRQYMDALNSLIKDNKDRYSTEELNRILEYKLKGRVLKDVDELDMLDMSKIDKLICSWYPNEGKIVIMCKPKDHNYLTSWMREFIQLRSADITDKHVANEYANYNEYAYNDYRIITVGTGYETVGDIIIDYMGEKDKDVEIDFKSKYIVTDKGIFELSQKEEGQP